MTTYLSASCKYFWVNSVLWCIANANSGGNAVAGFYLATVTFVGSLESIVRVQWRSRSLGHSISWNVDGFSPFAEPWTSGRATQVQQTGDLLQAHVWISFNGSRDRIYRMKLQHVLAVGESSLKFCLSMPGRKFIFSKAFSSGMKDMMRKGVQSINTVQFQADFRPPTREELFKQLGGPYLCNLM